jgi:hypothetical protein
MTVSLTSCPAVRHRGATSDERSPALWRGAPPNQGPGFPGVKVRQAQDGLKIDTTCSARRPGRVGADRLAHPRPRATSGCIAPQNRPLRLVVVYGHWPGPTLPRLSATARSAGMRLRSTLVVRRTCRAPRCELMPDRSMAVVQARRYTMAGRGGLCKSHELLYFPVVRHPA